MRYSIPKKIVKSHKSLIAFLMVNACLALGSTATAKKPYSEMDKDEAGLWYQMDKIEQQVKTAGIRITDPELVSYVQDVTCKVIGEDCQEIRVYIINAPVFNAAMAPNGMMLVNSGLLLRTENEAQLSCVLGHEFGHFDNQHSLKQWRSLKDMANFNIFMPIAGAFIGAAAMQSYSREFEREADTVGFEKAAAVNYQSAQCSQVWTALIGEQNASSFKKVRKKGNKKNNGIFSSHPVPKERAETLKKMAEENPGGDYVGLESHRKIMNPYLEQWLETELLAKDFDRHIYLFNQLQKRGYSKAMLEFYLGEAYRLRRGEGDREKAFEHWKTAAESSDAPAKTWRALGEYYRRKKQSEQALHAYETYISKSPNASDKVLIESYIRRLKEA